MRLTPPNSHVRLDVGATTVAKDAPADLAVERRHGTETVTVGGGIPAGAATVKEWIAVHDPTAYATSVFADALRAHGVRVPDGPRPVRAAPPAPGWWPPTGPCRSPS
ncbi:D-alanyl-D-alanine carboxypeptidase [Streptomyces zhihengii]